MEEMQNPLENTGEFEEFEDEDAARRRQEEQLQAFGYSMAKLRDEWIRARYSAGLDKRWAEDVLQYESKDPANRAASQMMESVQQGYPVTVGNASPTRSTVYIGITRQKTNLAEARLADIVIPTGDKNFGIEPTPDPALSEMLDSDQPAINPDTGTLMADPQTGEPLQESKIASDVHQKALTRAKAMEVEIDDQLLECDYNAELRKVLHDAAVFGTGVIKGPIVTNRTRQAWLPITGMDGQTVQTIEFVSETSPASFRVDPRNVWPDPGCGDSIHNGKGIFERERVTAKQIRDLARQPGFMKEQLRKVLEEGPKSSATMEEISDQVLNQDIMKHRYEMWTYWGELNADDLQAAGVDAGEDDPLLTITGCVIFINSVVVKAFLNPLETGDIPYDFFPWEKGNDSVWGYGIPYLMRPQQKVMNAAWRTLMDNAGVSSGPQIVVKPSVIQPADKQWQLTSRKIWYATDDTDDVRKAFTTFEFDSHQQELAGIIEMASKLADEETSMPMMMQGEKTNAPETVGGMQMLMNASNVVLRRLVKQFDDYITKPHIRRYYTYNMLYSPKEEIKGDFSIDARGSSALIVRDIQNQAFMGLLAAASNPVFGPMVDAKRLFEKSLQAQHIDPSEIMKSDDEIKRFMEQQAQAAASGQQDPQVMIAQMRIEAEQARIASEQQRSASMDQQTQATLQAKMEIANQDYQFRLAEMQLQREVEMLKLAQTKELTLEQIKASLADTAMKERAKRELYAAEHELKLRTGSGI